MSKKRNVESSKPESATIPCPKIITLHPRSVQRAMNKIVGTLNNPDYQEQMTKITQASVTNSLQTLQKLSQIYERTCKLDNKGWDTLINGSIDDLMRAYLQFNSDLTVLIQKLSNKTIEIFDRSMPSDEEEEKV